MTLALAPASVNEFEYSSHAWRLGNKLLEQLSVDHYASGLSSTQRLRAQRSHGVTQRPQRHREEDDVLHEEVAY